MKNLGLNSKTLNLSMYVILPKLQIITNTYHIEIALVPPFSLNQSQMINKRTYYLEEYSKNCPLIFCESII